MKLTCTLAIVCTIFFISSCKKDPPSPDQVFIEAHKETVSLKGNELSSDTIHLTSNDAWKVIIDPSATWLTTSTLNGSGNGDLIISSTEKNNSSTYRTANIEVKTNSGNRSVIITVIQLAAIETVLNAVFGGDGISSFNDFATTPDGGYIAVGYTTSTKGDASDAKGGQDLWIVKFDGEGNKVWHKLYGGSGDDVANSVVRTASNNYLVLGTSNSSNGDITSPKGDADAWLLSIDGNGSLQWQKNLGGTLNEALYNIKPGGNGTYLMSGWTISSDNDVTSNHGSADAWLVKVNDQGTILWQKTYGGSNQDLAFDATPVSDGGIIFCGQVASADGDASDRTAEQFAAWFVKLNAAGNIAGRVYVGTSAYDFGKIALEADNGDYVFAGETNTPGAFDGFHAARDVFICRLDGAGNFIWQKAYGGAMRDEPGDLIETTNGNFVFAGLTMSSDGDIQNAFGGEDAWIMKLDGGGNILTTATFGGPDNDNIFQVKQLNSTRFAFAGQSGNFPDAHPDLGDAMHGWFQVIGL